MYGMVNKAIEDLLRHRYGDSTWDEIKRRAGVDVEVFVSMSAYPDAMTYDLVNAASAVVGAPAAVLLEAFGEYWTLYTARQGYGELLRMGGDSLCEFLLKLDNLHTHVGLSFPQLRTPSFWCTDMTADSVRLHYRSTREGLAPMVVGLVTGLGRMLNTETAVEHAVSRAAGADHDEFVVRFRAPG